MASSQYAEIHNCTFHDGHKEVSQPGDTVLRNRSVLSNGVVDGQKKGNGVKSEEEVYISEFDDHGIWLDEAR